ncbi:MAG TPA: hypothetical protein VKB80_26080 [Kofleriaceae bacterium]|nr:hypothetical protein [Kofleriaceae bacterium]
MARRWNDSPRPGRPHAPLTAADEAGTPPEALIVEGMLVGGDEERVDVVVSPYVLSFERSAISEIEALPDPAGLVPGMARAVRLHLEIGARLFGLSSSADLEDTIWRRRNSFAVATRSDAADESLETDEQRALTSAFLARHGIAPPE